MPVEQFRGRAWVSDSIALGAAVGIFGAAFGILATTNDLSVAKTMAMSMFVFTGASQFAAVSTLAAGGSSAAAVAGALLLAARNALYGVTMSRWLVGSTPVRAVAAQLVIDESTGMATAQEEPDDVRGAFWVTGVAVFVFWNLGTLIGALGGTQLGDPRTLGLDAAFPAGFVALAIGHLRSPTARSVSILAALITLVAIPLTPPGVPILLASLSLGMALRPPPAEAT